jgi:glycosyltransferase involved in cell wall biosynthesis
MKLLLTNFHEGDGGGHTTYLMALAQGLGARHQIHVAAPPGSRLHREASSLAGVRVLAQPFPNGASKLFASLRARRQLRDYLRRHAFDIVHVNGSADHRLVLSASRGLVRRPKIVFTKHNSKPAAGFTHRLRAKRTDLAIAVSDATLRELQATPYAACAPRTIRNGVDIRRYAPWPAGDALAERERWCGRDGLASQIHFAGLLADVRPMIAAIDAGFVLSYAVETISFACREMMAMGKPVLVSDYAGLPENIDDGVNGWIVPVRNRDAIAHAISGLLDGRDRLPTMGAAARAKAERAFGLEHFVDATEAAYVALLPATGTPPPAGSPGP